MNIVGTKIEVKYHVVITQAEWKILRDMTNISEAGDTEFDLSWDQVLEFANYLGWSAENINKLKYDMVNTSPSPP